MSPAAILWLELVEIDADGHVYSTPDIQLSNREWTYISLVLDMSQLPEWLN